MYTSFDVRDWLNYLFADELLALKDIVNSLPPFPTVVNIGSGGGTSGLAIMETRQDVTLYTVDIRDKSSPFGCLEAERDVMVRAGFGGEFNKRWFQICGDSKAVGRAWESGPVDMVFIDGDHSYEGCKGDIETWLPRLKSGGLLLVHDYKKTSAIAMLQYDPKTMPHYKEWRGVDMAVDEILETGRVAHVETVVTLAVMVKK
jgi:predicted O-methyltransferase YrrM